MNNILRSQTNLTLIPLGTGDATRDPHQHFSSYLLHFKCESQVRQILLDVGSSVVLDNPFIQWDTLTHIILSHHHIDHSLNLGKIIQQLVKNGRTKPLEIISHIQGWNWLQKFIKLWNHGQIPAFLHHQVVDFVMGESTEPSYSYRPLKDFSQTIQFDSIDWIRNSAINLTINLSFAPARHVEDCIATRMHFVILDSTKGTPFKQLDFVYSPDTSFESFHLISFAQNAHYWLLDTTFDKKTLDKKFKTYHKYHLWGSVHGHSSPEYSAQLCERAHVRSYLMGHYYWKRFTKKFETLSDSLITLAKPHFTGQIVMLKELSPLTLEWVDMTL